MITNIFASIPKEQSGEIFEILQENQNLKIERIISAGDTTEWLTQEHDEWVLVLQGDAKLEYEEQSFHLTSGDYLFIPKNTKHKVSYTSKEPKTIWLAIHLL